MGNMVNCITLKKINAYILGNTFQYDGEKLGIHTLILNFFSRNKHEKSSWSPVLITKEHCNTRTQPHAGIHTKKSIESVPY